MRKDVNNQNLVVQYSYGLKISQKLNFWVFWYCSSNITDMVQIFKINFPFSWMNFWDYFEKSEFLLSFCGFSGKLGFSKSRNAIWWNFHVFFHLTTLSHFNIFEYRYKYQSWIRVNQRWKPYVSKLWKSSLSSTESELILFKTTLISGDVFHNLWIGAEKRHIYKTELFSPNHLWNFNPRCTVFSFYWHLEPFCPIHQATGIPYNRKYFQ